jgi:hypothetical protein
MIEAGTGIIRTPQGVFVMPDRVYKNTIGEGINLLQTKKPLPLFRNYEISK